MHKRKFLSSFMHRWRTGRERGYGESKIDSTEPENELKRVQVNRFGEVGLASENFRLTVHSVFDHYASKVIRVEKALLSLLPAPINLRA